MKTFKNKKGLFYSVLFFLITAICASTYFSSCEVGLGGAVDIQSPVVSITYPPSLSVIRDSFVLAGTWSDDHGVKTVHVDVYQSLDEGKKLVHQEEATVSLDGNWSITLNNFDKNNTNFYNGWEFADGDYEIQVTAEDHAKHFSGIASRTISIDNTAPVLVITNPTTAGSDATPAAFGQIVQLKGSFYDFCGKLTGLTVTFYDETGNAICDSSFSNISDMSDANPLTIARYYSTEEDRANNSAVYNNYKALFGTDKLESFEADAPITNSKIYFTVTANDSAKEFKTIGDEGVGKGNITKIFYRGTTSMQNLVSGDGAIEDFSLVDFASYLNKTSTKYSSSASTIDSIAAAAQSFSTTKAETPSIASFITNNDSTHGDPVYLTCTINPKNNPQYIIGGYELIEAGTGAENYSSAGYKTVYHGSPVPLNITVGADNKNISTHTVSFYLVDTTEYTGEINAGIFEQQHNPEYVELLYTWDEDVYNRYSAWGQDMSSRYTASSEDTNVSSIAKQFTIESLKPSHDYLFYVVGKDITGNDIISADARGYGFCYTVSTTAPEITITGGNKLNEVVSAKKFNGENASGLNDLLYITGTIKTEKVLNSLSYILTVTESSDSENPPTLQKTYTVPLEELDAAPGYTYSSPNFCYTTNAAVSPITYYWQIATARVASDFATIIAHPGSYDVTLVIKANNDAESSTQRTFTLDTKAPEAEATEISNSVEKEGGGYWINPGKAYKIKGLVTDNLSTPNACKTWIVLKAIDENEAELDATYSTESNKATGVKTWEFTVPANAIASSNYGANLYIYSQDVAGNTGVTSPSQLVKLYFDTVAPKGIHLIDYKNKDIVFRVSDFDSSEKDVEDTEGTVDYSALDNDVGGKYLKGSYSNTSTLKIRGYFEEDGSGVDMIYYKVFDTQPSDQDITNFKKDYANSESTDKATGYFKPLENPEEKQVMFQIKEKDEDETDNIDDSWYAVKVKSTFKETISGLDHSHNYLVLLAVDKVGNLDVDTLEGEWIKHKAEDEVLTWKYTTGGDVEKTGSPTDWNGSLKGFSLNVDSESPILNCTSHSGQQYTNGVSEITVSGTFTDNPSGTCAGVSSISINIHGVDSYAELTPVAENDYSSGTWEAKILSSTLSALEQGETYNANGTIKDRAGNTSSATMFTLSFDKEGPTVKVETPAKNTKVNGTISMTGSVEYVGSAPVKLELYAQKTAPSGELTGSPVETITDTSKIYSWNITDIDTYTITNVEASSTTSDLYIIPVVTDGAGNTNIYDLQTSSYKYTLNTNYFKYTVDMDSDRPTVKVTNLTNTGTDQAPVYILKYGENAKIEGSVSDDDSTTEKVVKNFVATTSQLTSTTGVTSTTDSTTGIITSKVTVGNSFDITTFNPVTGEWNFTPADTSDGHKTVNFYIVDNADTIFYTGKTETYLQPYFQFKTSTAVANASAISYKSDSTSPQIQHTKITTYDSEKTQVGTQESVTASTVIGGTKKKFVKFEITAYDANDIEKIRLTLKYKSKAGNSDQTQKLTSITNDTGFTKNGTASGTTTYVWTTDYIDVSGWKTDSVTGTVETYDKSGLLGTASSTFFVDNSGPTILVNSPSATEELTGTQTFAGTSQDSGSSETSSTAWLIPTTTQTALDDASLAALSDWNSDYSNNKTATSWEFELVTATLAGYDSNTYTSSSENGVYVLPFYVMAIDELGNYTIKRDRTFKHNPDADRPKTEIIYPSDKNYGTDQSGNRVQYVTLGGAIRISGSAAIPSNTLTVDSVYVQVINGTNNLANSGTYTTTSAWAAAHGCTVLTKDQIQSGVGKTLSMADSLDWGIKAEKTAAWSLTINSDGLMNPDANQITYIAIRACGINTDGKVGAWTDWYYINIDNTAPSQSAMLYQFTDAPSAGCTATDIIKADNIIASRTYESDMYLKGAWYLTVKLHDESEIDDTKTSVLKSDGTAATYLKSSLVTGSDGKERTQYLFIPVDYSNNVSSVAYTITVADSKHSISDTYSLNIDNTAPELTKIYKGSTDNESNYLSESETNTITDSNYVYTLGGKVSESGSGFERLVFYYVRANGINGKTYTSQNVLDPLITTGHAASKAPVAELTKRTYTQGSANYYMYAKSIAGTLGADGFTFTASTASNISGNAHIRAGGLIEVGGLLRKIETISGGTVTFDKSTGVTEATAVTAYFPYAQVVDNTTTEKVSSQSANPFTFEDNTDDHDLMPETLTGSKSIGFTWDATIHSSNIPDGPCALVVLAFDKAGNVSGKTYDIKVENSAPRLAKIFLGTDLNSSGTWTSDEFVGYDLYNANQTHGIGKTEVKARQTIATANYGKTFTVKDKLAVVAEVIGGNGTISMVYKNGAENDNPVTDADGKTASANNSIPNLIAAGDKIGSVEYNQASVPTSLLGYTLTSKQVLGIADDATIQEATDGTGKKASFTFWDSTDELVSGSTSQNCVFYVTDLTFDLKDGVGPKVVINPFYWESKTENSLYSNSSDNGHIELEADWQNSAGYSSTATSGEYDKDPKVSGKITFTGTAYDDHALKTLNFTLKNSAETPVVYLDNIAMATYTPATGWNNTSGNSGATLANGGKYEWTISTAATETTRHYGDTAYLDQNGHKVYWTISIDTAQISDVAATDVVLSVTSTDLSDNNSVTTVTAPVTTNNTYVVTDGTTSVPSYKMDVVPYITGISTSLDGAYKNKTSVFNRSALGSYPVRRGETITVSGFNLKKEATAPTVNIGETTAGLSDAQQTTSTASSFAVNIPNNAKSGDLDVTVNGVVSLNNKTIKTVEYNQEPNGINNDILTDARKLSVWSFKTVVEDNTIRYPTMRVGKDSNQTVGFAYDSGAQSVYLYDGSNKTRIDYSYTQWYDTGLAVDNAGRLYVGAMNGDSAANGTQSNNNHANYGFYAWINSTYPSFVYSRDGTNSYAYNQNNETRKTGDGAYSHGYKKVALENTYNGSVFNSNRVLNPKIAVVSDTTTTSTGYVYTAYYDAIYDQVRFRYGTVSGTMAGLTNNTGRNIQNHNSYTLTFTGGLGNHNNRTDGSALNYQVIAGMGASGTNTIDGVTGTANTGRSGEYVAIGIIPKSKITDATTDAAIIAWYDASNTRLLYSYNLNPTSTENAGNWGTNTKVIDSDFAGWYADMAVDPDGGIHIAYYGASNGDLKYAYLSSYSAAPEVCTVDSYLSVGSNISIDVPTAKETVYNADGTTTTRYVPRISYFMSAFTKTKYSVRTASLHKLGTGGLIADGVDNDKFTGNWEVMTIPTDQIPLDYTIGVGLKKNDSNTNSTLLGYGTKTGLQTAALQ